MPATYIIDSDVFVQSKNREYRFQFAGAFWEWVLDAHAAGVVFSISKVLAEINQGRKTCPLRHWATTKVPKSFWLPDSADKAVMQQYAQVVAWAYKLGQYDTKALSDFASSKRADAFLIAVGKAKSHTIVTHEGESTNSVNRVMIPHAAHSLGVNTLNLYDLLSKHATQTFKFHI
jgi:Domain of unknown function (DUF4411)